MKINYTLVIIIVLAALVVAAGSYIVYDKYTASQDKVKVAIYQAGYQQAILEVMKNAAACQAPVPLYAGNETINLLAVECLNQQQMSCLQPRTK